MSLLDLIQTVGRAASGTRAVVAEQFDAVNAMEGGLITLPFGTQLEITCANGSSLSAVAEVGNRLRRVYIFVDQCTMLAVSNGERASGD